MRLFLILVLFYCQNTLACSSGHEDKTVSFAIELEPKNVGEESNDTLRFFQVLSSIQKEDMFLQAISINVKNEFRFNLDIVETSEYISGFYSSYFQISDKHVDDVIVMLDYNATNKERTEFALCANWVHFKLMELLAAPRAGKTPLTDEAPQPLVETDV